MTEKHALVVRGGWDGHAPVETTNIFIPHLEGNGFQVTTVDGPASYADAELMASVDLIVQAITMSTITTDEFAGLEAAVKAGTGLAGWHGGIVDSFRNNTNYLHLTGGQFGVHPGVEPSKRAGDGNDNFIPHRITVTELGKQHPIFEGLDDFDVTTEQYWVLSDDYNDVLATSTHDVHAWEPWNRAVTVPAIWTRQWAEGRIFVATPGHRVEDFDNSTLRTIIERGLLWAAR